MKWSIAISGLLSSAKSRLPEGSDATRFIDEAVKMAKEWHEIVDSETKAAHIGPSPEPEVWATYCRGALAYGIYSSEEYARDSFSLSRHPENWQAIPLYRHPPAAVKESLTTDPPGADAVREATIAWPTILHDVLCEYHLPEKIRREICDKLFKALSTPRDSEGDG